LLNIKLRWFHLLGVLVSSILTKENLVKAILNKQGLPAVVNSSY
jgi:hypothetical protein